LEALVNPNDEDTTYQFEYLSQAAYEANGDSFSGLETASKIPVTAASVGSGHSPALVLEQLEGLDPATSYRFRLVATNGTGISKGPAKGFATYSSPDVHAGACPGNESFREANEPSALLPDCRAYEQASPTMKSGGNLQGKVPSVKAANEGAAITFESAAGIPGGEGSQEFPTYLASRGEDGRWSTQGLLPNASAGQGAKVEGWTPDFSLVFDSARIFGLGSALLSRSSADGSLNEVVPYRTPLPTYSFTDSSADGSKVVFEAGGPGGAFVPEAKPGKRNLYAWDGADPGTLHFAGLLPDGSAPPSETVAGETGGTGYLRDTHAVSGNADSVYFTARDTGKPTGQLYQRLNPAAAEATDTDSAGNCVPHPDLACTLHVSASEKTNGTGPDNHDAAGKRPAAFKAASTDGSIAYFTSSEKLTNDANTGPEPQPAAIASADLADGTGVALDFLPASARGITVLDDYVYWANPGAEEASGEGMIGRAKLGTNGPEEVEPAYITALFNPRDVAVASGYVYWTEAREGNEGEGSVGRAKIGATEAEEVNRDFIGGAYEPRGISVSADNVYWVNSGFDTGDGGGFLGRSDVSGTLASVNQKFIEFASGDVAITGSSIYFSRLSSAIEAGFIRRYNIDGSEDPSWNDIEITGVKEPPALALDASHLYWTNPTLSKVGRSDLNGTLGSQEQGFIVGAAHPQGVSVDAAHVYWSASQEVNPNPGNDLYRFEADAPSGARLTDIAIDTSDQDGIKAQGVLGTAADGSHVYYVANGVPDGEIQNNPNAHGESAVAGDCKGTGSTSDPASGSCNLYLWHEGETSFIARLNISGGDLGDFSNWVPQPSVNVTFDSKYQRTARVSRDGETILFRSHRQLSSYDNEGNPELYWYRAGEEGPVCISCNPTGAAPIGYASLGSIKAPLEGAAFSARVLSRNLAADGSRVFFETSDALVPADTNGLNGCPTVGTPLQLYSACQDVYEWEEDGRGSCQSKAQNGGCLSLLSTGKSREPSFFGDANESGDDVFIFTTQQLVPQDKDELLDAYDVRVGGGLAYQHQVAASSCQGDGCKSPAVVPPAPTQAGSAGFSGPSSPRAPRHHKKKHHKKKHARHGHGKGRNERHGKARTPRRAGETTGRTGK
jgi:hypothetical protein